MEVDTSVHEEEEEEEQKSIKKKIVETIDYLITHDKKELNDILDEFEKDEIFVEDVSALRQLVEVFIRDEFFEKRPVIPDIKKILTKLSSSKIILKSKLHRVEMLLEEITRNRARVQEIVNRMGLVLDAAVEADVLLMLKQLTSEGHLSLDQYFKIIEMKNLDMNKLIPVIKETKIG